MSLKFITYLMLVFGCSLAAAQSTTVAKDAPKIRYPYRPVQLRNPFFKGTSYSFETRNTSMRWKEIALAKTQLPVLEIDNNLSLSLLSWSGMGGFAFSGNTILPAQRKNYYHNGIFTKGKNGEMYYQMIRIDPTTGQETLAGWVSGQQLVSPMANSLLSKVKTEGSIPTCVYMGTCVQSPADNLDHILKQIEPSMLLVTARQPMNEPPRSLNQPSSPPKPSAVCPFSAPLKIVKTSQFGYRKDPFTGRTKYHSGCDLVGQGVSPAPIKSVVAGRVTKISGGNWVGGKIYGVSSFGGYGFQVEVTNDDGTVVTYNHMDRSCINVTMDQRVEPGTQVGCMGSTGRSTGAHLHLELKRNGIKEDPEKWQNFEALCAGRISTR